MSEWNRSRESCAGWCGPLSVRVFEPGMVALVEGTVAAVLSGESFKTVVEFGVAMKTTITRI